MPFGVLLKRCADEAWHLTWADRALPTFPPGTKKELDVSAGLVVDPKYPGCPFCGAASIFRCGRCEGVCCWDGMKQVVTCSHCDNAGAISGGITSLGTHHG